MKGARAGQVEWTLDMAESFILDQAQNSMWVSVQNPKEAISFYFNCTAAAFTLPRTPHPRF